MTITSNETRNEYTATSGQTVFTYTFKIFADTEIRCFVTPTGQEPNDSTDEVVISSVTGVGNEAGGTITIPAVTLGYAVTIISDIAEERTIDYQINGDFTPDTVNDDFDRVLSISKQTSDLTNRGLTFQESVQNASGLTLSAPEALSVLQWKPDLTGLQNFPIPDLSDLTDGGDTALHYHSADRARANHTGTQTAATISDFDTEVSNNTDVSASKTITDFLTVTQAVDLDTMESDTATNNAKVTNATHSGDVAGSGVLTIQPGVVDPAHISATGTPGATTFWRGDNVWVTLPTPGSIDDTAYTRAGWDGDTTNAATKNALSDTFYNMVRYLDADTGAVNCTFIGETGNTTCSGDYNFAAAWNCGRAITTGVRNTLTGAQSGRDLTGGDYCCFYGNNSGLQVVDSSRNNGYGADSLYSLALLGEDNCAFGYRTLYSANHANADKNCAFGNYSLDALTSGSGQVAVGYDSGSAVTIGIGGIHIGSESGSLITTSDDTISIGRGISAANASNRLAIGRTDGGNAFIIGVMNDGAGRITIGGVPQFYDVKGVSVPVISNDSFAIEYTNDTTITFRAINASGIERTATLTLS